jgi:hypothetical protein
MKQSMMNKVHIGFAGSAAIQNLSRMMTLSISTTITFGYIGADGVHHPTFVCPERDLIIRLSTCLKLNGDEKMGMRRINQVQRCTDCGDFMVFIPGTETSQPMWKCCGKAYTEIGMIHRNALIAIDELHIPDIHIPGYRQVKANA